jgi:hypothetical protein
MYVLYPKLKIRSPIFVHNGVTAHFLKLWLPDITLYNGEELPANHVTWNKLPKVKGQRAILNICPLGGMFPPLFTPRGEPSLLFRRSYEKIAIKNFYTLNYVRQRST